MIEIIAVLNRWGCDTHDALDRLSDEREVYVEFIKDYMGRIPVRALQDAIDAENYDEAFRVAHSMKGVLGNLGLTPLYKPVCEITEAFRNGAHSDVAEPLQKLLEACTELNQILDS